MQHNDKTALCKSRYGSVSVFNNAVAFELKFRQISAILDSEKVHQLNDSIQHIKDEDWMHTSDQKFAFINLPQLEGNYMLTEEEIRDLRQLLLEASAMIKVHHRLYFKHTPRIN